MRLHFQKKPWDLGLAVGYALVMTTIVLAFGGDFVGFLLVLFVPGYVLVAALFPSNREYDWIERIALSIGLSIVVVPLLGLGLNFTPFGIRLVPILGTIDIFTVLVGLAAYWRRMQLAPHDRLRVTLDLAWPAWKDYTAADKILTVSLSAGLVAAGGTLAYAIATPRPSDHLTQFFILGPGGNASGYPARLNISQSGSVILGIANHEAATVNYTVRVDLVGVQIVYNATARANETVELNRTTWSWFNTTLGDGQNWTHPYPFSIPSAGLWKVQFLLFKEGDFSSNYRELHLYVRVT